MVERSKEVNWWRGIATGLLGLFGCFACFAYYARDSQVPVDGYEQRTLSIEESSRNVDASVLLNFQQLYQTNAEAISQLPLPFLADAEQVLAPLYENEDPATMRLSRALSANIKRIKIIGSNHKFVIYPVSKKACYKQATQERFSVDVALTPREGLGIMVSQLPFSTPRCFEQRWDGLLSPYFSELNYNLKPDEVSNFIMYLPLPALEEKERDTFLI